MLKSLTPEEMEETLDKFLDPVLSFRRTAAEPAEKLSAFNPDEQAFAIYWVEVLSATNAEFSYQFAAEFSHAYHRLDGNLEYIHDWIIEAMDAYDRSGLMLAIKSLQAVDEFAQLLKSKQIGATLAEYKKLLETFVCGLSGRQLDLQASADERSYSDSQSIYLPIQVNLFQQKEQNFLFYKAMLVYHWAENWFGTFRQDLELWSEKFNQPQKALQLLSCFENIRLDFWIAIELPGLHSQMQSFREPIIRCLEQEPWQKIAKDLQNARSVQTSLNLVEKYYLNLEAIPIAYSGYINATQLRLVKNQRLAEEKTLFKALLGDLLAEHQAQPLDSEETPFSQQTVTDTDAPDGVKVELYLDGQLMQPPEQVNSLLESILLDLGEIPPEYLHPAGPGSYRVHAAKESDKEDVWHGIYHEDNAFFYDEWDILRQHYKQQWCVVREMSIAPIYDDFVETTLAKHLGLVKSLRHTFEVLRGEQKLLKRQVHGDDIDIDAVVESYADLVAGFEMSERLFIKSHKVERDIAVVFLIDMSGSTQGWINQVEREALVLLCESLQILGDRYAIYGFSGIARKRCEVFKIKQFEEAYDDRVKGRISGISAKDYTRMGFAIRHMSHILSGVDAKTKLMISLSDGKPEDYDGQYRGEYGIEDTRQALIEAKQQGIHTFCITIDEEAKDYLPHMYGVSNYAVIDEVSKLPQKVSEIYRKLTT